MPLRPWTTATRPSRRRPRPGPRPRRRQRAPRTQAPQRASRRPRQRRRWAAPSLCPGPLPRGGRLPPQALARRCRCAGLACRSAWERRAARRPADLPRPRRPPLPPPAPAIPPSRAAAGLHSPPRRPSRSQAALARLRLPRQSIRLHGRPLQCRSCAARSGPAGGRRRRRQQPSRQPPDIQHRRRRRPGSPTHSRPPRCRQRSPRQAPRHPLQRSRSGRGLPPSRSAARRDTQACGRACHTRRCSYRPLQTSPPPAPQPRGLRSTASSSCTRTIHTTMPPSWALLGVSVPTRRSGHRRQKNPPSGTIRRPLPVRPVSRARATSPPRHTARRGSRSRALAFG
mmetsp:Transcript_19721/g.75729  ORF Transcript_19721/g.75729 Transcript_19721/m.75729 type:complete len:341 (-) Transcript_19721:712-1734(-)